MSPLDKRILNRIQQGIPFETRPWRTIARELGIEEDLLLGRIARLKEAGIIRRISAVFSPRTIDFVSTLAAVKVAKGKVGAIAKRINRYPEVTHNYRRDGAYDLWFTLVARNRGRITHILRELEKTRGIRKITEFPMVRLFKINVKFAA